MNPKITYREVLSKKKGDEIIQKKSAVKKNLDKAEHCQVLELGNYSDGSEYVIYKFLIK